MSSASVITDHPTGYRPMDGRRDESIAPDGSIELEWHDLYESVNRHGNAGLTEWRQSAARISRERGLAYRPATIDDASSEGWSLDPVPWILSAERWSVIESGIAQRLRLSSALLEDLYGPRRVLKEGLVPGEIILNHRGFLRALHDAPPGNGIVGLGLSAFDLARDSQGRTFVVNDRFDCPSGLGLALENRTIVNKVLPNLFRRCGVRRIGTFFADWFSFLGSCSPGDVVDPLVVILDNSEQQDDSEVSFLANYCGITRVHPSDITVRDGRTWIKALRGLVPVNVIWKSIPGCDLDSLESEIRPSKGIAGLFESLRSGSVAVASHPGAEVIQSPGLYPFLENLCRTFLGEDLLLSPVPTWWCGDNIGMSHVQNHLDKMVVKSVENTDLFGTHYGRLLSVEERESLLLKIKETPGNFVGQEELLISSIPSTRPNGLEPRSAVLRTFSFIDKTGSASVMPGGLARVSRSGGFIITTGQSGESKDVWVRSLKEEKPYSISSVLSISGFRVPDIVSSRTGENLFWSGRYAERIALSARFAARLVDCRSRGVSGTEGFEAEHEKILVESLFDLFECSSLLKNKDPDDRLKLILDDSTCPAGIMFSLERFNYATQAAREEWSPASILAIGSCYDKWKNAVAAMDSIYQLEPALETLQLNLAGFLGLNLDSMTRDSGWALLDAGRQIERGSIVCGLLRTLIQSDIEGDMNTIFNESVLYFLDSVRTYQSSFYEKPQTDLTTLLLLGQSDYPKSVLAILERLSLMLKKLPTPNHQAHPRNQIPSITAKLHDFVQEMFVWRKTEHFDKDQASEFLDEAIDFFSGFSDDLTTAYFSHALKQE